MKQKILELIDRYIEQWNWDEKQLCRQIRHEIEDIEDENAEKAWKYEQLYK